MLPYQAVAMDYAGYQRQPPTPGHPATHMTSMGTLGMPAPTAFTHSWIMPTQDLCAVPYNKMPNQHHQNQHQPQPIEPGLVKKIKKKFQKKGDKKFKN